MKKHIIIASYLFLLIVTACFIGQFMDAKESYDATENFPKYLTAAKVAMAEELGYEGPATDIELFEIGGEYYYRLNEYEDGKVVGIGATTRIESEKVRKIFRLAMINQERGQVSAKKQIEITDDYMHYRDQADICLSLLILATVYLIAMSRTIFAEDSDRLPDEAN